jgi:general secretion pathway protein A
MYQDFYGLRELPFELTPNPRFLYMTPGHREALSTLQYGLSTAKPVTVLIGEAGTGKTTLLRAAFESERCSHVQCVYVNNPALTRDEFIHTLAGRFGLSAAAASSKALLLAELELVLVAAQRERRSFALVIDEAQRLSDELLEEVRLLANIETPEQRLLPLVLTGQPELAARLNHEGLRQLKQRVSLRCEMKRFDLADTAAYIAHRVHVAGGDALRLFTREAITVMHERSGGIPRTLSVLGDNALLSAFAQGLPQVGKAVVLEVCRDFDFGDSGAPQPATQDVRRADAPQPPAAVVAVPAAPALAPIAAEAVAPPPAAAVEADAADEPAVEVAAAGAHAGAESGRRFFLFKR